MMIRTALAFVAVAAALLGAPAFAQDIPAGWSVDAQPKRAVLTYAPEANGPRYLIVACLRDSDEIGIYSAGIATPSGKPVVALGMNNAGRKYTVRGEIGMDNITNQPLPTILFAVDLNPLALRIAQVRCSLRDGAGRARFEAAVREQERPRGTPFHAGHSQGIELRSAVHSWKQHAVTLVGDEMSAKVSRPGSRRQRNRRC